MRNFKANPLDILNQKFFLDDSIKYYKYEKDF